MVLPRHCKMSARRHCTPATPKTPLCYWILVREWTASARAAIKHSGIRTSSSLNPLDADPALDDNDASWRLGPWAVPGIGHQSRVELGEVWGGASASGERLGDGGGGVGVPFFSSDRKERGEWGAVLVP